MLLVDICAEFVLLAILQWWIWKQNYNSERKNTLWSQGSLKFALVFLKVYQHLPKEIYPKTICPKKNWKQKTPTLLYWKKFAREKIPERPTRNIMNRIYLSPEIFYYIENLRFRLYPLSLSSTLSLFFCSDFSFWMHHLSKCGIWMTYCNSLIKSRLNSNLS